MIQTSAETKNKQDSVAKHTTTPLSDPTFDFGAWTQKHLHSSEQIAETWVKSVVEEFGGEGVKFGCVGYWSVSPLIVVV